MSIFLNYNDKKIGATTKLAIGLGQTTPHTLGSRSEEDLGRSFGGVSAPAAVSSPNAVHPVSDAVMAGATFRGSFTR